jgi:serine/threonine-protein kinase
MPYIQGETIRDKLGRETQFGIDEAVRIAREVADALDYAHRNGVIHRDIKPENILLHDGRPMVMDFGIALAVSAAAGGRMTETGLSLGTPHYMSPEQATADRTITARSDIYSLASVLYEMLTGEPPHMGTSAQQIIMKIIAETAKPVTELRKSVPGNVAAALAKALEKLPADRFDSAKAFAEALGNPQFTAVATAGVAGPRGPRARLPAVLAGLVVVLTGALVWSLQRSPPRQIIRYGLALPSGQAVHPEGYAVVTRDGARIVYTGPSSVPGLQALWVKDRNSVGARYLPGTDGASSVALAPDGRRLAIVILNEIRVTSLDGGGMTALAGGVSGARGALTWLEDGSLVYVAQGDNALMRIFVSGSQEPMTIWRSDSLFPQNVTTLPDARGVFFQTCVAPCATGDLNVLELGSDSARLLLRNARRGQVVEDVLFYAETRPGGSEGSLYAVRFDRRSLRVRGDRVLLADTVGSPYGQPLFDVSASGSGVMMGGVSAQAGAHELVWVDQDGRVTPVDTTWRFRVTQFAADYGWSLSPDGRHLAVGVNTSVGDDIWVKQLPRGPLSRMTFGTSPERRPHWRPEGRWVTFLTDTSFSMRRADGTGGDSVLFAGRTDEGLLSDDGHWILLRRGAVGASAGGRDVFVMRVGEDSVPRPLLASPYDEMAITLSPGGRWLAYQSDETGRLEVFVRPFPNVNGGKVQVSSEGGSGPLWSRDGRTLFYLRRDETMMAVAVAPDGSVQTSRQRELFRRAARMTLHNSLYYTPWDVAADGRFIMTRVVSAEEEQSVTLVVVENWLDEVRGMLTR